MPSTTIGMGPQDRAEREQFENELQRIIRASNTAGLTLRVLGSLAFQIHCPKFGYLQEKMGRAYTDIDFAGYRREAEAVCTLMNDLGYGEEREAFILTQGHRAIFNRPEINIHVDVFYEKLDFCHVIQWDRRLEVDSPTIPLAEMLLEKMQIVEICEKDVIDTIMLLLEHPLGKTDDDTINMKRVSELCSQDWGLWRTVTMNLNKVGKLTQGYDELSDMHKAHIASHVEEALAFIEAEPKSLAWRLRHRVGDRVKWYKEVDEVK